MVTLEAIKIKGLDPYLSLKKNIDKGLCYMYNIPKT
jgi:hypothetical protein